MKTDSAKLKIIGHRGARGLAPENTLAAIGKGLKHHVDEIEIDVRVTKDDIAILMHDNTCSDASGRQLLVRNHSYNELRQHKPDLATLAETIIAINRQVPLQIEIKRGEPTAPIVKVVKQFLAKGWQPADFVVGSKKQQTLLEVHHALPGVPKVVIEPFSSIRAVWRAKQVGTKRLSMRQQWLWSGFIRAMHRRGYRLYAYTLNDPVKAKRWHRYGLAGVITDTPDVFEHGHRSKS